VHAMPVRSRQLAGNHAVRRTPGDSRGETIHLEETCNNEGSGRRLTGRPGEVQRSPVGRSRGDLRIATPKCYLRKSMAGSSPSPLQLLKGFWDLAVMRLIVTEGLRLTGKLSSPHRCGPTNTLNTTAPCPISA